MTSRLADGSRARQPRECAGAAEALELPLLHSLEGRLVLDERRGPSQPPRTIPLAYRLRGSLSLNALRAALDGLVRRHEALRTTFPPGRRVQAIQPAAAVELVVADRQGLAPADADAEVGRLLERWAALPFERAEAPRLHAQLIRLAPDEHVLDLVVDHLVADGWSLRVLLDDLGELYGAAVSGRPLPPSRDGLTYRDVVEEEAAILAGPERERLLEHWRARLDGSPPVPLLKVPPAALAEDRAPAGGVVERELSSTLAGSLAALGRSHRVTPFVALLTVLECVFYRLSGDRDQAVAAHVLHRDRPSTHRLVAPLADFVVIRSELDAGGTFADAIAHVRDRTLEAFKHAALPFGFIVRSLDPTVFGNPSFPLGVVFNMLYDALLDESLALAGLDSIPVAETGPPPRPRGPIGVSGLATGKAMRLVVEYQQDRLRDEFVVALLDAMESTLGAAAADPAVPLAAVPVPVV